MMFVAMFFGFMVKATSKSLVKSTECVCGVATCAPLLPVLQAFSSVLSTRMHALWFSFPVHLIPPVSCLSTLLSSAAKEPRTSTSSSPAPSLSSRRRTSWSSPTSTRPSSPASPSSTSSSCTRRSVAAYEKDGGGLGEECPPPRSLPPTWIDRQPTAASSLFRSVHAGFRSRCLQTCLPVWGTWCFFPPPHKKYFASVVKDVVHPAAIQF